MKNRFKNFLFSMVSVLILTSCNLDINGSTKTKSKLLRDPRNYIGLNNVHIDEKYNEFVKKLNVFSADLSEVLSKKAIEKNENIAFSPMSIELCLGLAICSTNNETRQELLDLFDLDFETFNKYYGYYFNENNFEIFDEKTHQLISALSLTNSIWVNSETTLKEAGLNALMEAYKCYCYSAPFSTNNKEANKSINKFINDSTRNFLNVNLEFDVDVIFVLLNTLYLKDIWNEEGYDLSYAKESIKFINSDSSVSNKRLLEGKYVPGKCLKEEKYSSFYTISNRGFTIHFIKPNESYSLGEVFTKENIQNVLNHDNYEYENIEKLERYHTRVIFPEFSSSSDIDLIEEFSENYNLDYIFRISADFSNLTDEFCYVSSFRHIAKLDVNKKGIIGAAVTFMAVSKSAIPGEFEDIYFDYIVDKEFGYVITYKNNIVFSGVINNIDK